MRNRTGGNNGSNSSQVGRRGFLGAAGSVAAVSILAGTGSEASATYRWLKPGARMSPAVGRLMYYMKMAMLAASPEKRSKMLESWRETVQLEGTARGVADIFKSGAWSAKEPRPPRKRAAAKKVAA